MTWIIFPPDQGIKFPIKILRHDDDLEDWAGIILACIRIRRRL